MGVVYEAHDPALSRKVALKTIQPVLDPKDKEAFEQRFFAEARIAARLSHPGIVVVRPCAWARRSPAPCTTRTSRASSTAT
jgi:serine/threonine protein kinase